MWKAGPRAALLSLACLAGSSKARQQGFGLPWTPDPSRISLPAASNPGGLPSEDLGVAL